MNETEWKLHCLQAAFLLTFKFKGITAQTVEFFPSHGLAVLVSYWEVFEFPSVFLVWGEFE